MNNWNIILHTYMEGCSRKKIIKDIFLFSSKSLKLTISISFIFLLISLIAGLVFSINKHGIIGNIILFLMIFFEIIFIKSFGKATDLFKKQLITSDENIINEFELKQSIPYLKLKNLIKKKELSSSINKDLDEIITSYDNLIQVRGKYAKTFITFAASIIIPIILVIFRKLSITLLIKIALYVIIVFVFLFMIISIIPSELEQARELNYFLKMIKHEMNNKTEL